MLPLLLASWAHSNKYKSPMTICKTWLHRTITVTTILLKYELQHANYGVVMYQNALQHFILPLKYN